MICTTSTRFRRHAPRRAVGGLAALLYLATLAMPAAGQSPVPLADQPIFGSADVPGNMIFTPSVEFPTAISVANLGTYNDATAYLGYFDPAKCYTYQFNSTAPNQSYFQPTAFAGGTNGHSCSGQWSGSFMNWATMQTIDPFRWVLTGGYRSVDTTSQTILEKAWAANQGGTNNFPYRGTNGSSGNTLGGTAISTLTPFTWSSFNSAIWSNGNMMAFSASSTSYTGTNAAFGLTDISTNGSVSPLSVSIAAANSVPNIGYRVYVRVSVCDTSVLGVAGLESNCVGYGTPTVVSGVTVYPTYKPQGLIQQYSNQIKYSVMGYLNTANEAVQGGVLREPMEFVGPTYPTPLSTVVTTNPNAEWSASTGIMSLNPDPTNAAASGVPQSGVMNYLNSFGEYGAKQYQAYLANPTTTPNNYPNNTGMYMTYDHVSELYYAALRYYENLGNVTQWLPNTSYGTTSKQLDGFPAVVTWTDPIAYSCQNNFILGIGDDHTWTDYDVGGSTVTGQNIGGHSPVPSAVSGDTLNQANTWLYSLQSLEGITQTPWWPFDSGATYYIAGLAYGAHVTDIRPDASNPTMPGMQTVSTYWMDVAEDQEVENLNPYYLATKYGGFSVPSGYSITNTTPLPLSEYDPSGATILMNGNQTHPLPSNYFETGNATQMVNSLTAAFTNIANSLKAFTTSFSFSSPVIATSGETSFTSVYDPKTWSDTLSATSLVFLADGTPQETPLWASSTTMQTQLAGTGWQTARKVVTWNGSVGLPFEPASLTGSPSLSAAEVSALTFTSASYSPSTTPTQYINYLRGDTTNQVGSTATGSTKSLRARSLFLGDIVDANLVAVAAPTMSYADGTNPGYSAFKTLYAARNTMVYAAANDGMLHGFDGTAGTETFAYVPSAVYQGPTGTPLVNGLQQLGNPNYVHHFYVDATPLATDIDLNHTGGNTTGSPNWHTVLIGGLGKGGKSYYAIDVTNPAGMSSESAVASDVMWEFTDSTMGYSFGLPTVVKTTQYGWVVVLTSGYDNSDGYGYLYLVNPTNGTLLQKIKTPIPSSGLAQATAFLPDATDYTADSVYVGDLNGQLWRFDLTAASGTYPAPTQIALLADAYGNAQPVTTAPNIEVHPTTRQRYVLLGTGKLLANSDVSSTAMQTFYAIKDGTAGGFLPVSTPITRSLLYPITDLTLSNTVPAGDKGWYYDLGTGWRDVSGYPVSYNGIIIFSALSSSTNACSPSGTSEIYGINYATGTSVLNSTTTPTTIVSNIAYTSSITNMEVVNANGSIELIAGTTTGAITKVPANLLGVLSTRVLNWRDVPTAE
jgi:type IV pilus assembly protein PilY1